MTADPAHRHGGPDAGWYVPGPGGWQRISDGEVGDHGDAAHFMSDPDGRHETATVAAMEPEIAARGGNGASPRVAPDGRTIIGGGGAGDSTTFGSVSAGGGASPYASGGIIPQGSSLRFDDRVQVYADGMLRCTHATITDHGQKP